METIKKIADECLDNLILNAINTIRKNKKRPDASSIYEFIYKKLKNPDITIEIVEKKTIFFNQENKCINGENFYFVKAPVLPSAKDESLPLPVICETPSVKYKEKLVPDKTSIILEDSLISLEEKISVLNTTIELNNY